MNTPFLRLLIVLLPCMAFGQVPTVLAPLPQLQFLDQSGRPLAFGCVFSYASQTTTQIPTYSDFTGQFQNQNPVLLNSGGSANIWLKAGQAYTLIVKSAGGTNCANGTTIYSVDGVGGGSSQLTTPVTPAGGSVNFPVLSENQLFTLTLTSNTAGQPVTFTNVTSPAFITFQITEDGTGGRTFTWPANVIGAAPIDTAANHVTSQTFTWNGTSILPVGSGFTSAGNSILPGLVQAPGGISASSLQSSAANPAGSGVIRLADADTACWRNHANSANVCVSKNTSDQLVIPSTVATNIVSATANPAASGIVRLAKTDTVCWRNNANSADVCASLNGSDQIALTSPSLTSPTIATGIAADGSGFKHKRFGATCSTTSTIANTCTTTYSWTTAFADANYTPVCTGVGPTQGGILSISSFNASGVTVIVFTTTAASASYSSVDCVATHD